MMKIEATPLKPVPDRCKMRRHVGGSLTLPSGAGGVIVLPSVIAGLDPAIHPALKI